MSKSPAIDIRIWGARGTFPIPGPDTLEFGGHTCCVEVRAGGQVMIFDAGSGIIPLGQALTDEAVTEIDLFFRKSCLKADRRCAFKAKKVTRLLF